MSSSQTWLAWREILAEVLEGFTVQENVTPDWLVNPETGRQLKLDLMYPEVALAVHFRGARPAAQKRRTSDQEMEAEARREDVRRELCRQQGVVLVSLNLNATEPREELDRLHKGLSAVTRRLAHASIPHEEKVALMDRVALARRRLADIRERVRRPEDLAVFADKWRDREAVALRRARQVAMESNRVAARTYKEGMRVQHERFGEGVVLAVFPEGEHDQRVVVDFPKAGKRTFLASLVAEKLEPLG